MQSLRKLICLILLLASFTLLNAADIAEDLKTLTNNWNALHNTQETKYFSSLYADRVLFYGKYRTGKYCTNRKAKFLNQHFSQKIITPITVQFYSSGTAKASFIKEVTYKEVVKKHSCYLLFKEKGGIYQITGESDLETDEKLNVQLDLGQELHTRNEGGKAWIYILLGLGIVTGVGVLLRIKKKKEQQEYIEGLSDLYISAPATNSQEQPVLQTILKDDSVNSTSLVVESLPVEVKAPINTSSVTPKEKGDAFEEYIVSLFDVKYGRFRLLDWRSDKKASTGLYALSNHLPDLVLDFNDDRKYHKFAIECKWRSSFQDGKIDWAKEYQIKNYLEFQQRERVPVFVAIGIGGKPNEPEQMFIAPLKEVSRYASLYETTLKKYSRHPKHKFFYNYKSKILS